MRGNGSLLAGPALVAIGSLGLLVLGSGLQPRVLAGSVAGDGTLANGARIFQAGADIDGRPISHRGGTPTGSSALGAVLAAGSSGDYGGAREEEGASAGSVAILARRWGE